MPMNFAYIELELDAVEERGAGRVPQEMAKNPATGGCLPPFPDGIPANLVKHRQDKTERFVGTRRTQTFPPKDSGL